MNHIFIDHKSQLIDIVITNISSKNFARFEGLSSGVQTVVTLPTYDINQKPTVMSFWFLTLLEKIVRK